MIIAPCYSQIEQLNPHLKVYKNIPYEIIENLSTIVKHKTPIEAILSAKENREIFLPVIGDKNQPIMRLDR